MKLTLDIANKDIVGLICSGLEGGIGYWAKVIDKMKPANIPDELRHYGLAAYPLGGYIQFDVLEEGGRKTGDPKLDAKPLVLDYRAVHDGLETFAKEAPRHFGNFLSDQADAETGDVFIQCCLFGKVVFG